MLTYLVTGGAGFIGSHIVEALLGRGGRVRVLDNFSTGKRANLANLTGDLDVIEGDITHLTTVQGAMRQVDYVLHEAAIPAVQRSVRDPFATDEANVRGTLNVLWAAKEAGVKRVVYAASSSAYGEAHTPTKAETLLARPLSPYGVSKLAGEMYCGAFYATYGLETVALRYFNVFGPRQNAHSEYSAVIPKFVAQLLAGQAPVIFGDGEQTRDFTYVANVVAGNLLALEAPAAPGQTFNMAAGESISLNKLLQMLGEIMGVPATPMYAPARRGDIRHSAADISKAQALLNYRPLVDSRTGLQTTITWMREQPVPVS